MNMLVPPLWVADTEPNQRLSLYTRGNVGEVFPHVITALTGTLIGDAIRRAQADVFVEMGFLRRRDVVGPSVGTGVFGGYLYMNASTMRLFGVRMPGMSWRDADSQVMGDVEGVPDYTPAKGDRSLGASWAIMRRTATLLRRPDLGFLDEARRDAARWMATMPDLVRSTDAELIEWLAPFPARQGKSMQRLLRASVIASAPRSILDQLLERTDAPAGLANRMVSGTGDVDSSLLAQRLWVLARLVADDPYLTGAFDRGLDGIADRVAGSALAPALESFLDDHGHRGNDEYELATPAWAMDPTPLYAAIDRLRRAPADRDPARAATRVADDAASALGEAMQLTSLPVRRLLRRSVDVARLGSIARERAKDILVLENLGARLVLHELLRRAAERGGPADPRQGFCITIDELADYVARPEAFAAVIDERSRRCAYLNERVPPPWFETAISDPSTWSIRTNARAVPVRGTTITGIAVSGGCASGPARVIADPGDPRGLEPGEVLVCAITDPSWTPLFLGAVAVVCDTGAVQSHAAIIARELGIPAVMSAQGITGVEDGTVLHVDGDVGTVRIQANGS